MRCAACGALNADHAEWCTQCFATLRAPTPTVPPPDVGSDPGRTTEARDRDVRVRDDEVEWRCGTCEAWTPLHREACHVCGAPRQGFGAPASVPRPATGRSAVLALSLLLPGLGHLVAGRVGTGLARAVLALVWAGGGFGLLLAARDADASPLAAVPLLLGAVALWVLTLLDARALLRGDREVLTSRLLLALTGAVLVASLLLLVLALPR